MTNGDKIRSMDDEQLISLLCHYYRDPYSKSIPDCSDECEHDGVEDFCLINCPIDCSMILTEKALRKWIMMEADDES